jgi:hypothetical protein
MLMAAIEREGIGATAAVKAELAAARTAMNAKTQLIRQVTTPGPGRTRAAIIAGVAAGALALSGVSLASTDSVPGDALYSVKRSSEQAQLVLAGSDANRGRLHLEFAKSRLLEAGQVDGDDVLAALATMDDEVLAGARMLFITALQNGDESAIDAVLAFVRQQRADLSRLRADLPQAEAVLRGSLDLLGEVESRANQLGPHSSTSVRRPHSTDSALVRPAPQPIRLRPKLPRVGCGSKRRTRCDGRLARCGCHGGRPRQARGSAWATRWPNWRKRSHHRRIPPQPASSMSTTR